VSHTADDRDVQAALQALQRGGLDPTVLKVEPTTTTSSTGGDDQVASQQLRLL
jgi:hypothetical protein